MLCSQVEEQMTQNKLLRNKLQVASNTVSMISNMHRERQTYIFKYRSPILKEDYDKMSSPYGYRELLNPYTGGTQTGSHRGLDVVGTQKCLIRSIALNGEVMETWPAPDGYYRGHPVHGGYVIIKHDDKWIATYSHLSKVYIMKGDLLIDGLFYRDGKLLPSKGNIGRQGDTGQSEGEHLHVTIQKPNGELVDPLRWIDL